MRNILQEDQKPILRTLYLINNKNIMKDKYIFIGAIILFIANLVFWVATYLDYWGTPINDIIPIYSTLFLITLAILILEGQHSSSISNANAYLLLFALLTNPVSGIFVIVVFISLMLDNKKHKEND